MGSTKIQTSLFLVIRRLVLWICKGRTNLIRYFSGYLSRLFSWFTASWTKPKPPSGPSILNSDTTTPTTTTTPYTIVENGETLSLDGIATSLYPFSNGNIRNTSRSSVRSSQNPSVRSRNASRSSRRPGSVMSRRSAANSEYVLPIRNSAPDPNASRLHLHLISRRQSSASIPSFYTGNGAENEEEIDIQVTSPISPGNYSQNSLPIPSNVHPFSHGHNIEIVDGPTQYEHTTLEVPPSPVSSKIPDLSRFDDPGERSHRTCTHSIRSTSSLSECTPDEREIRPVFPCETKRYSKRTKLPKVRTNLNFPPINLDYSKPSSPEDWVRYPHPEGARYFHNKKLGIYTDSEIHDPEILAQVLKDYTQLKAACATCENPFPSSGEFVINVYRENVTQEGLGADGKPQGIEELTSEYYCVDHRTRLIFFLKKSRADWMDAWHEVQGVRSEHQLRIELLAQYWFFVQLYPSAIELKKGMVRELRDIVLHLIGDSMTSPFSTACFPLDTLYKILSLANEIERNLGRGSHGSMCTLARNLYIFNHSRFLNFHGESSARIERDFSVYDDQSQWRRSWLIKSLSLILFSAPEVHLTNLHKMWVDSMMHNAVWEATMKHLNEEWQEFVFFATVVLNANVAFLAIQSVDTNRGAYRSPAQISSYLSVVANIGSIILGLLLMRQNRTKHKETAEDVQAFLIERNHPTLGLESLAILYSLPYALLMWGMVAFLAAFAFTWFQVSDVSTRSLVGPSCVAMIILIVWSIYVSWERKDTSDTTERALTYMSPDDLCEETVDENDPLELKEKIQGSTQSFHPPALGAIGRFFGISGPVQPRESYDSGKTAVTPADV